jgi:hypothetical protein
MTGDYVKRIEAQAEAEIAGLPPISFISARDFTPDMQEARAREMERLYADPDFPRSMGEIAIIYGMTRERVRQIFNEYNIPRRTKKEATAIRVERWRGMA